MIAEEIYRNCSTNGIKQRYVKKQSKKNITLISNKKNQIAATCVFFRIFLKIILSILFCYFNFYFILTKVDKGVTKYDF